MELHAEIWMNADACHLDKQLVHQKVTHKFYRFSLQSVGSLGTCHEVML